MTKKFDSNGDDRDATMYVKASKSHHFVNGKDQTALDRKKGRSKMAGFVVVLHAIDPFVIPPSHYTRNEEKRLTSKQPPL